LDDEFNIVITGDVEGELEKRRVKYDGIY